METVLDKVSCLRSKSPKSFGSSGDSRCGRETPPFVVDCRTLETTTTTIPLPTIVPCNILLAPRCSARFG